MKDNEQELKNIKKYLAYLKENFEVAESYFNMICRTFDNQKYESKINHLKDLLEFLRQKVFNDNEINYNIDTIKDNIEIINDFVEANGYELDLLFSFFYLNFGYKPKNN
jgi:hypothetical protein